MAIQHKDIDDPNIHEPKGVSGASNGQVYVANGAGSGSWQTPTSASDIANIGGVSGTAGSKVLADGANGLKVRKQPTGGFYATTASAALNTGTYAKLNPSTTAIKERLMTHSNARLTVNSGVDTQDYLINVSAALSPITNGGALFVAIAKNGTVVSGSEMSTTVSTTLSSYAYVGTTFVVNLAAGDYIEVFAKADVLADGTAEKLSMVALGLLE